LIVVFSPTAWAEFRYFQSNAPDVAHRIAELIDNIAQDPFRGLGKPEPLKHEFAGFWSRRITGEHRLVYRVSAAGRERRVEVAQCRYHY